MDRWSDGELLSFRFGGAEFWYDTFDDPAGRESRTVAGWTRLPDSVSARDARRQREYPLASSLVERGFERGHLIARASGGGLDVNLFPQAWQVNQGRGVEGKEFRRLERLAAASPGALQMTRLLWDEGSNIPTRVHMIVAVEGRDVEQAVFGNEPIPRPPLGGSSATDRLRAGTAFHRRIQTAFVAELFDASAHPESTVRLLNGRTGRIDLLVVACGGRRMAVVVEVKNTDWDSPRSHRIRPNIRAHVRQIQGYLDSAIAQIGEPEGWQDVVGVLIYPKRPSDPTVTDMLTRIVEAEMLTIVWHDETTWS